MTQPHPEVSCHTIDLLLSLPEDAIARLKEAAEKGQGWIVDSQRKVRGPRDGVCIMKLPVHRLPANPLAILRVAEDLAYKKGDSHPVWSVIGLERYVFQVSYGIEDASGKEKAPCGQYSCAPPPQPLFASADDRDRWAALYVLAKVYGLEPQAPRTCATCGQVPGRGYLCEEFTINRCACTESP